MLRITEIIAKLSVNDPAHFFIYTIGVPYFITTCRDILLLMIVIALISKENRKNLWIILWVYLISVYLRVFYYICNPDIVLTPFFISFDTLLAWFPLALLFFYIALYKRPSCCSYTIDGKKIFRILLFSFLVGVILVMLLGFINLRLGADIKSSIFSSVKKDIFTFWIAIAAFVFITPFVEETLFRGFIFNSMRASRNLLFSIVTSSFIFAAFHSGLNIPGDSLLSFFLFGIVMAFLVNRYRNLLIPIIAHATFNLSLILLNFIS